MIFNIQFQIAGFIVLTLVAALYYKRRSAWIYTDRVFSRFIIIAFTGVTMDVASVFTINFREHIPDLLNEVVCKLYLYSLTWVAYITFLYLLADLLRNKADYSKWLKRMNCLMIIVGLVYIFLPIEYHLDTLDRSIYTLGPAVNYTYAVCIMYLIISLAGIVIYRSQITSFRRNPVLVIIISFFFAAILQFLNNQLLIVSFAMCVSILLIYLFMENPSDKMDEETGMYNISMLKTYIERKLMSNEKFFVITISLKSYSIITSTFGITSTGKLLSEFSQHLRILEKVHLFRLGESRFAIAGSFNTSTYDDAVQLVNNLPNVDFPILNTTISLDIDACILNDSSLINDSNEAIYYINSILPWKKGIVYIDEETIGEINQRNRLEDTLKWAIDNDKFIVYYQPIYSVANQNFVSMEALVRLWDENNNYISPDTFIPIAEHNGMITTIDMIVLDNVCRFIKNNNPHKYGIEFIEVNLSVVQCMQNDLATELKNVLDKYKIPLEHIHFEITETAMAKSRQSLSDNMNKLINLGSAFFLDDYGSGYANLNFLIDLPFRAVKLDKELVWSYFTNKKGEIATKFAIDMLKSLDMEIVAEGIETKEQLDQMEEFGIEYIQGYFLSKPLSEKDVINFLAQQSHPLKKD